MSFDKRERELESMSSMSSQAPSYAKSDDLWAFKKETQERMVALEAESKFRDRLWKERLVFISILIASWLGLGAIIATLLRH